jgi:hypothetical protein
VPLEVPLVDIAATPKHVAVADEVCLLHRLGFSKAAIARRLDVTRKTVARAMALGWPQP